MRGFSSSDCGVQLMAGRTMVEIEDRVTSEIFLSPSTIPLSGGWLYFLRSRVEQSG